MNNNANEDRFAAAIKKNPTKDEVQAWCDELGLATVRSALNAINHDLQAQLTSRKADFEEDTEKTLPLAEWKNLKGDYTSWRAAAIRYKKKVERTLGFLKIIGAEQYEREQLERKLEKAKRPALHERIEAALSAMEARIIKALDERIETLERKMGRSD